MTRRHPVVEALVMAVAVAIGLLAASSHAGGRSPATHPAASIRF